MAATISTFQQFYPPQTMKFLYMIKLCVNITVQKMKFGVVRTYREACDMNKLDEKRHMLNQVLADTRTSYNGYECNSVTSTQVDLVESHGTKPSWTIHALQANNL